MLDKLNVENLDPKHIEKAYVLLKEYCDNNGHNVIDFVSNKENIKPASEYIHSQLGWLERKILSSNSIENLINKNIDFIITKAKEFTSKKPSLK